MFAEVSLPVPLDQTFTYHIPEGMSVAFGNKVKVPFGSRQLAGFVVALTDTKPEAPMTIKDIGKVTIPKPLFDVSYLALARWVANLYFCSLGEALEAMLPSGAVRSRIRPEDLDDLDSEPDIAIADNGTINLKPEFALPGKPEHLSKAQSAAIQGILDGSERWFYLYGRTGSGKTEVFLRSAERVLEAGKAVIYLVPEISLTAQVIDDIQSRFPLKTAVLHSRLTPSQRLGEWQRIESGDARLVVGARSAVFAPVHDLGLIILDEEHESSYKSSSTPRYHARQIAMYRVSQNQAKLVMGSATPSVESWELMRSGRIKKLELPARVSGGAMPEIRVSSLSGVDGALGPELIQEIRKTAQLGAQTILFLNRRGFSYFFNCKSCGYELVCSHCSVSMTYHRSRERMVCHYCGRTMPAPRVCPGCGSPDVGFAGFGTEFVEDEVRKLFPDLRIARVDTDAVRRVGTLETTLREFRKGNIDLLLGTQMVAKGLNFPNLRLVGIVLADGGLHLPDFRAAERTFSLLVQVAGRAGRYRPDGLVLIQAIRPEHPVIQRAAAGDLDAFYEHELDERRELKFPPFSRLVRLVFRSGSQQKSMEAAILFLTNYKKNLASVATIYGPAECPLAQVNGNWRHQILFSAFKLDPLHLTLAKALSGWKQPSGVHLEVDIDPANML